MKQRGSSRSPLFPYTTLFRSLTKMFYVAAREMGSYYYKSEAEYKPGTFFAGGGERALEGDKAYGAVRALEVTTGKLKWEFRLQSASWAVVLAKAGGAVFGAVDKE